MTGTPAVTELPPAVTAPDYKQPLAFYRDVLGLPERVADESPGGRVTILEERHPPSYRLPALITGIESMGVRAAPVGRASGTRSVPARPRYPGNGSRQSPSRRSS
jgi:hypothetical protein